LAESAFAVLAKIKPPRVENKNPRLLVARQPTTPKLAMSNRLSVITDAEPKRDKIRRELGESFELTFLGLDEVRGALREPCLLFDIDFSDNRRLLDLKDFLRRKPKDTRTIFVTDRSSRAQTIQAQALGASEVMHHPLDAKTLAGKVSGGFDPSLGDDPLKDYVGVGPALEALHGIFSTACLGAPLDTSTINSAGETVVGHIEERGLRNWIETVRRHHSQTYQHCLLVTGVAVAFGQQLGFSHADRNRLAFAGMVHDIGKARVPLSILEKPTPLTEQEDSVLRQHPELGLEMLRGTDNIEPDMFDIVLHHHEYVDGSGYPHGLSGREISDFVRVATICDVFGALLERRAYKPPIRGDIAYQMLVDMGPKLDQDLVRAFKFAAALRLKAH
jgi:putative nucleotidyltransferase with HDIG domain